jgi:hypothetical protein
MYASEGSEDERFRKKPRGVYPGKQFKTVHIVHRNELPTTVVPLIESIESIPDSIISARKLRLAYIPYIGFKTFHFMLEGQNEPLTHEEMVKPEGSVFVEYPHDLEEENCIRALRLLGKAIDEGANIVVFPEFVTSYTMRDAMRNYLETRRYEGENSEHLCLVFAGTTCEKSGENSYNNVLNILTGSGVKLRHTYYKNTPYNERGLCEILSDPGKELVILDIKGMGRILPAICKDARNDNYTSRFADIFEPDLILIPAWSESVDGFYSSLNRFAENYYAVSVLCNCCNAVSLDATLDNESIGIYSIPKKTGSKVVSKIDYFYRERPCYIRCRDLCGCVQLLDIDYSSGYPQEERVEEKRQKLHAST